MRIQEVFRISQKNGYKRRKSTHTFTCFSSSWDCRGLGFRVPLETPKLKVQFEKPPPTKLLNMGNPNLEMSIQVLAVDPHDLQLWGLYIKFCSIGFQNFRVCRVECGPNNFGARPESSARNLQSPRIKPKERTLIPKLWVGTFGVFAKNQRAIYEDFEQGNCCLIVGDDSPLMINVSEVLARFQS